METNLIVYIFIFFYVFKSHYVVWKQNIDNGLQDKIIVSLNRTM